MSGSGFLILLIFVMSCWAAPKLENDHCSKPEKMNGAQLQGEWNDETYPPGKVANFVCLPGYTQDGAIKMACIEGTWWQIGGKGQCKGQKCPSIHGLRNMEIINPKEEYYSGDTVSIRCSRGYRMIGSTTALCLEGEWGMHSFCIRSLPCRTPPTIQDGDIIEPSENNRYASGDIVKYSCKPGFHFNAVDQITCEDGKWSESPICTKQIQCPPLSILRNLEIIDPKEVYYSGDTVTVRCARGYRVHRSPTIRCIEGKWERKPACIRQRPCWNPPTIQDGDIIESFVKAIYVIDDIVKYRCNPGFHFNGSNQITCEDGQWSPSPVCTASTCKPPPTVPNSRTDGQAKASYASGEKVTYSCVPGYSLENSLTREALCENSRWIGLPVCRKIGKVCGPPPVVQYGDTIMFTKTNYTSGESVEYKCPDYYILKGNKIVTCLNGAWDEAPVCLEPCTVKVNDLQVNNLQLKWMNTQKVYSEHGDRVEFQCKSGYEAPPGTHMRIICEQGKLEYPKCFTKGYCALQQSSMITNNIHYNISTIVDNGQTIAFQCNEGMTPENILEAKCERSNINYPKCSAAKRCKTPEILNGFLTSAKQDSYDSGSHVEFECNEDYVIDGSLSVQCKNGQWMDLPVCHSPCKIFTEDLTKRNIQLLPSVDPETILDTNHKHGTVFRVSCKSGFRRQNQAALVIECYDGKFQYPRCFSGKTCRIDQDELDHNNLDLDEVHDNEVFYEEEEIIQFKCKNGFQHHGKPTGTCSAQILTYPRCTEF